MGEGNTETSIEGRNGRQRSRNSMDNPEGAQTFRRQPDVGTSSLHRTSRPGPGGNLQAAAMR